jgi:hypothetical protein
MNIDAYRLFMVTQLMALRPVAVLQKEVAVGFERFYLFSFKG